MFGGPRSAENRTPRRLSGGRRLLEVGEERKKPSWVSPATGSSNQEVGTSSAEASVATFAGVGTEVPDSNWLTAPGVMPSSEATHAWLRSRRSRASRSRSGSNTRHQVFVLHGDDTPVTAPGRGMLQMQLTATNSRQNLDLWILLRFL